MQNLSTGRLETTATVAKPTAVCSTRPGQADIAEGAATWVALSVLLDVESRRVVHSTGLSAGRHIAWPGRQPLKQSARNADSSSLHDMVVKSANAPSLMARENCTRSDTSTGGRVWQMDGASSGCNYVGLYCFAARRTPVTIGSNHQPALQVRLPIVPAEPRSASRGS